MGTYKELQEREESALQATHEAEEWRGQCDEMLVLQEVIGERLEIMANQLQEIADKLRMR